MKNIVLTFAIIFTLIGASLSFAEKASSKDDEEKLAQVQPQVVEAFTRWISALESESAKNVVELYHEHAILLATLESDPLFTQEERLEYFTRLLEKPEFHAVINTKHIRVLNKDTASLTGLYTFHYTEDEKVIDIPARYSFLYKKMKGKWIIIEHHSSLVPEANDEDEENGSNLDMIN